MRQEDIMRILMASSMPMAVPDILEAFGIRDGHVRTDLNGTQSKLYSLERYGYVRRAGTRPSLDPRGRALVLWEAVA